MKLKKQLKIGCKKSDKDILDMNVFYYEVFFEVKKNPTLRSIFTQRVTGLEPATVCLEGRNSSQLSYTRIFIITF